MIFLISLLVCIILHELSHLIVAKKLDCGVDIFSIGFGRPFYRKEFKGTIYQVSPILLGGYCKLTDELIPTENKNGFSNLPYLKKVYIAIAGCATNILSGLLSLFLGKLFHNYYFAYFGLISISLGITNLLPIAPCLDGGYIVYLPLFLKIWKEKGLEKFAKSCRISFIILMTLNILCIPYLIYLIMKGML
jgi:membrane-associated protease RseP (regulator of RpoE activity)